MKMEDQIIDRIRNHIIQQENVLKDLKVASLDEAKIQMLISPCELEALKLSSEIDGCRSIYQEMKKLGLLIKNYKITISNLNGPSKVDDILDFCQDEESVYIDFREEQGKKIYTLRNMLTNETKVYYC